MYYTKRPFLLGEPPYDSGGGSVPTGGAKPPPSFFTIPTTQRPTTPTYQPDYQSFFPPAPTPQPTVRPPLAPTPVAPPIVRPPLPTQGSSYIYDAPTGVAVSQKPPRTPTPPTPPPAPVPSYTPPPTPTQTNAPVYTGSTATHAETSYKGPTPVFATWQPGDALKKKKPSGQDRRKANQIRAEQNKKAREQAAKAARERLSKEQRKRADEYNKQQKKAAESQKKADEQYFKQMEAQEKALMKDREAQAKAQREAAKQREVIAKQEAQLAAQREQVEQQRRAQQEQQRQAAEKLAQATTPTSYPYDTSANRYPEAGLPPDVKTAQARGLVQAVYFTKDDIAKTQAPWGGYTSTSGDRIVKEIIRRGEILKKGEPKLLTEKRKAELDDLVARRDYLTPEEQARLNQLKSFMTPDQKMIMDAALGAPRKELENMATTILKKFGTATSPSAGGLITPESTEAEQSAAYEQRATEFASTWNQQFNEMAERVDLLKRLESEQGAIAKMQVLQQLQSRLTPEEQAQLNKGLVNELVREAPKIEAGVSSALDKKLDDVADAAAQVAQAASGAYSWLTGGASSGQTPEYSSAQREIDTTNMAQQVARVEGAIAARDLARGGAFSTDIFGLLSSGRPADFDIAKETAKQEADAQQRYQSYEQQQHEQLQATQEAYFKDFAAQQAQSQQQFSAAEAEALRKFAQPIRQVDTEEAVAREYAQPSPSAQPVGTPMTVLDKVPARAEPAASGRYGITDLISDARSTVSAAKMYSSPTSLLDVKNIGPSIVDLERIKTYVEPPKAQPTSFSLLRSAKVPEIQGVRTAVPIDFMMRSAKTVISPYAKELASAVVPQEYQKEAFDTVDAVTSWGSKLATDTKVGDTARAYLHRYAFESGPIAETVGAAAQRVGGSIVNVAQKIPGITSVSPYATKTIRFLTSQPVSVAGAIASGVVDYGRTVQAVRENWQAERDAEYQKQDYEQLRDERINTMNREEARLADRKKVLDYRIGEYDRWIRSGEFYQEGAWGREKLGRALDKMALMKEQLKLVDDALQNISQERLKDAQQYQARGLQPQEAARRQAEAEAAEIERLSQSAMMYTGI